MLSFLLLLLSSATLLRCYESPFEERHLEEMIIIMMYVVTETVRCLLYFADDFSDLAVIRHVL